jgi:hypothetical protein
MKCTALGLTRRGHSEHGAGVVFEGVDPPEDDE